MKAHGAILGTIAFTFTLGGALGPFFAGIIFDNTGAYQLAFLICTIFSMIALLLSISLLKYPLFDAGSSP
jgi:MFS family permease